MGKNCSAYAPTLLRVGLGLLMLIPGLDKLMGMLGDGHAIAGLIGTGLAWVVLLAEIVFGLTVLLGYKLKYTAWPPAIILLGAIFLAVIPSFGANPMAVINLLFHLVAILGYISLSLSGAGMYSVDKKM